MSKGNLPTYMRINRPRHTCSLQPPRIVTSLPDMRLNL